jgi:hypothetical protein
MAWLLIDPQKASLMVIIVKNVVKLFHLMKKSTLVKFTTPLLICDQVDMDDNYLLSHHGRIVSVHGLLRR